jgi:hypothetical protein
MGLDRGQSGFRARLALSGLLGLLGCTLMGAVAAWLVASGTVKPWLPYPWATLLFALMLGSFSLAEIPLMVYAMRRLAMERAGNRSLVLGLNALYVSFAAVYGVPVILLTGSLGWGLLLCALGLVRFVASLLFVVPPAMSGESQGETVPPAGQGQDQP